MRRAIALSVVVGLCLAGAVFAFQQKYPNEPNTPVVLENDRVVVQRLSFAAGSWQGEHSHDGNQLAVAITDIEQLVKTGDKEETRTYKAGDVFWVEKGTHDHKAIKAGTAVLITFK
jgi:quercetin dioxygenase-like cupin family protein